MAVSTAAASTTGLIATLEHATEHTHEQDGSEHLLGHTRVLQRSDFKKDSASDFKKLIARDGSSVTDSQSVNASTVVPLTSSYWTSGSGAVYNWGTETLLTGYMTSNEIFTRPVRVSCEMKADPYAYPITFSLFSNNPLTDRNRNSPYAISTGAGRRRYKGGGYTQGPHDQVHIFTQEGTQFETDPGTDRGVYHSENYDTSNFFWHKVAIDATGDGQVKFYVNDALIFSVHDSSKSSGRIAFAVPWGGNVKVRNVEVQQAPIPTAYPTASPTSPTASPTGPPTGSPTPAPAPTATSTSSTGGLSPKVSGKGDPHLSNMLGQHFDLMKPGFHTFVEIPRRSAGRALLKVDVEVKHLGEECADIYVQAVNVTGSWVPRRRMEGGMHGIHYEVGAAPKVPRWERLHEVMLKVVQGHTRAGLKYFNVYMKNLDKVHHPVGGLLGVDDHTLASTPVAGCRGALDL